VSRARCDIDDGVTRRAVAVPCWAKAMFGLGRQRWKVEKSPPRRKLVSKYQVSLSHLFQMPLNRLTMALVQSVWLFLGRGSWNRCSICENGERHAARLLPGSPSAWALAGWGRLLCIMRWHSPTVTQSSLAGEIHA
jgi:hypothetical protein